MRDDGPKIWAGWLGLDSTLIDELTRRNPTDRLEFFKKGAKVERLKKFSNFFLKVPRFSKAGPRLMHGALLHL